MTRHSKKKSKPPTATAAVPPPPQQLTPEQKQEQELNELLQLYSPDRREAMREKILQRNNKKDERKR
jgi:hypothetical protein